MKLKKRILIAAAITTIAVITTTATTATAQSGAGGFAGRLAERSAAIRSIECNFTLTRSVSVLASEATSEGRFYYLRGEGISLEFTRPAGDVITMGREKFRITTAGRSSVVKVDSNPALKQLQRLLTACMTGDAALLGESSDLDIEPGPDSYTVTMTPSDRRAKNMVRRVTMVFERENMSLVTLSMEEPSGDVSHYSFGGKTFNGPVDAARFEVK